MADTPYTPHNKIAHHSCASPPASHPCPASPFLPSGSSARTLKNPCSPPSILADIYWPQGYTPSPPPSSLFLPPLPPVQTLLPSLLQYPAKSLIRFQSVHILNTFPTSQIQQHQGHHHITVSPSLSTSHPHVPVNRF